MRLCNIVVSFSLVGHPAKKLVDNSAETWWIREKPRIWAFQPEPHMGFQSHRRLIRMEWTEDIFSPSFLAMPVSSGVACAIILTYTDPFFRHQTFMRTIQRNFLSQTSRGFPLPPCQCEGERLDQIWHCAKSFSPVKFSSGIQRWCISGVWRRKDRISR